MIIFNLNLIKQKGNFAQSHINLLEVSKQLKATILERHFFIHLLIKKFSELSRETYFDFEVFFHTNGNCHLKCRIQLIPHKNKTNA